MVTLRACMYPEQSGGGGGGGGAILTYVHIWREGGLLRDDDDDDDVDVCVCVCVCTCFHHLYGGLLLSDCFFSKRAFC